MPPSADHLKQHQFKVAGKEALSKKPFVVRLYASDDEVVKSMGKTGALFIRDAVREKLDREGTARPSGVTVVVELSE